MKREDKNYLRSLKNDLILEVEDIQLIDIANKESYYNCLIDRLKELAEDVEFARIKK